MHALSSRSRRLQWLRPALLVLLGVLGLSSGAFAREPQMGEVQVGADIDLTATGSGTAKITLDFAEPQFAALKAANPNPHRFLRDFASNRTDFELGPNPSVRYDDAASAVRLELTELGALRNHGEGQWSLTIEPGSDYVNHSAGADGRIVYYFTEAGEWDGGIKYRGTLRYKLPAGAQQASWDAGTRQIQYVLPRPEGQGPGRLLVQAQSKTRLMAALYKVYGLGSDFSAQWVSKALLKNTGQSVLRDVRVRYQLEGYSNWSIWQKFPELVPGQVAVSRYYPVLQEAMAGLSSNTPANVLIEWRYTDHAGKRHEDTDGTRITILGRNEFVMSNLMRGQSFGGFHDNHNNAPMLAAWVSRDDPVVKEFASMANKIAGGAGASSDNRSAITVIAGIWELWRRNDFTYQHPPGMVDNSVSFDPRFVQNIKFPRDVIRDKSGTCIDLAICMAAMGNSVGLKPYLMLIPGHCFPIFRLPDGTMLPVEATGIAGGLRHGSVDLEKAVKIGQKTMQEYAASGNFYLVDPQALWTKGVSNPELPELPADILSKWRLSVEGSGRPRDLGQNPNPGMNGSGDGATPRASAAKPYLGKWIGQLSEKLENGQTVTYPVMLTVQQGDGGALVVRAAARAEIRTPQGVVVVEILGQGAGQIHEGRLVAKLTDKRRKVGEQVEKMTPDDLVAQVQNGVLVGRSGNETDGYVDWQLKRARGN